MSSADVQPHAAQHQGEQAPRAGGELRQDSWVARATRARKFLKLALSATPARHEA
eukprot:CAMPEP_0170432252 /NCGR_PEP_ID=MMETSP0117_2-20130122/41857_1 /TAXON_ID=400756 /ORGANISM="Durinskia baltica, Strain CSIRO CS-38" /LENGTH=54 /DNA_ID=CAMNT_0010691905 /DNA_START=29 /DNA_END=190 /DNA_ORIENTATION=-